MAEEKKSDRILIVDDNPRNIQVLGTILKEQGYQINVAQNGLKALDVVAKVPPDIILLDVMMPELDGFETCKRLKADASTEHIPVIFLTAKVETDEVVQGFELGAIDYVTKPFNPTELLARVDTHLQLYKLKRNLEQLVEERTEELRGAHRKLQLQVKELESRDRLAQLQMKSPSLEEAFEVILTAVGNVLNPASAKLFRVSSGTLSLAGSVIDGKIEVGDAVAPAIGSDSSVIDKAFSEKRPLSEGNEAAVPVIFGDTRSA